jgi:type IX secretion system PorP/SprF family membrane protein
MPALGSPWVSYNASFDMPVKTLQGGIGVNIMNDVQGPALNRISADAIYSYFLAVNPRLTINAGFQASYIHRFLNTSALVLPDEVGVPAGSQEVLGNLNRGFPDFAVGFVGYTRSIYAGVSMHHLTKPNQSLSGGPRQPLPRKLTVHGGMYLSLYERRLGREALKLNPGLVYLHQGSFRQINYGLDVIYKSLMAGAWFRHGLDFAVSSFAIHLGYAHEYFRISYSHDFNVYHPWISMRNMGAHELTFLLKLENGSRSRDRFRTIKSPKI